MIQVRENLILNGDKLQMPGLIGDKNSNILINDGKIYFDNLTHYMTQLTIDGSAEKLVEDVDPDAVYYVGIYGRSSKPLELYKGDSYKKVKIIGDYMYIEMKGEKMKGPIHVRSNSGASGYIYGLGIYKDFPSEVYLPNKNSVKPDNQAIYPPEGHYKEIQPR